MPQTAPLPERLLRPPPSDAASSATMQRSPPQMPGSRRWPRTARS